MIHIPYDNKDYYLPENFNELTKKQLLILASLLLEKKGNDHRLKVLHIMLNISLYDFFRMPPDAKERMLPFIDFVFDENTLTTQLLPSYKGFCGPKSEFDNLTLGEFHYSESYYHSLAKGDVAAADKLIAVLYRAPKENYDTLKDPDGDIRVAFNQHEIEYWSEKIKSWRPEVKTAIIMWYDGCRQHLVKIYDEVFSAPGAPDPSEEETGMYGVIRNLSGEKFGTIRETEHALLHHALYEITLIMEDNRRAVAELKSNTRS